MLKKVTYFIYENWTKIERECKEREMKDRYDDDEEDYKGKLSLLNGNRVIQD